MFTRGILAPAILAPELRSEDENTEKNRYSRFWISSSGVVGRGRGQVQGELEGKGKKIVLCSCLLLQVRSHCHRYLVSSTPLGQIRALERAIH